MADSLHNFFNLRKCFTAFSSCCDIIKQFVSFVAIKFTKRQSVSELVSQLVSDKHKQWSDSGPIKILFIVCVSQSDEILQLHHFYSLALCLTPFSLTPEYSLNLNNENTKCWRLYFFALYISWCIPPRHGKCVNFSINHFLPWKISAAWKSASFDPYNALKGHKTPEICVKTSKISINPKISSPPKSQFLFTTKQYLMLLLFARQIHFIDSSDEDEEYLLQLQEL